jgi:hypothetical protein
MNKKLYRELLVKSAEYAKNKFSSGDFAEFGCQPGVSGQTLAKTLKRNGCFFDTWTGVPHFDEVDVPSDSHEECILRAMKKSKARRKDKKRKSLLKEFKTTLKRANLLKYCEFINGDICETVPEFMKNQPEDKFIFSHIDCNMHKPAKTSLFELWKHLADGGIIYFDDYKDPMWPGIEEAINEFRDQHSGYAFVDLNPCGVNNAIMVKGSTDELSDLLDYFGSSLLEEVVVEQG